MDLKNELCAIMNNLEFPSNAASELSNAFDKLDSQKSREVLALYDKDINCDYSAMLSSVAELGKAAGVHEYTFAPASISLPRAEAPRTLCIFGTLDSVRPPLSR